MLTGEVDDSADTCGPTMILSPNLFEEEAIFCTLEDCLFSQGRYGVRYDAYYISEKEYIIQYHYEAKRDSIERSNTQYYEASCANCCVVIQKISSVVAQAVDWLFWTVGIPERS